LKLFLQSDPLLILFGDFVVLDIEGTRLLSTAKAS
jgi:hypothetical protein